MKIHFEQSGGFVAGVRRPPVIIDTSNLPAAEAKTWDELVSAADFFNLPATLGAGLQRDAFTYAVTIESEGKRHAVRMEGGAGPTGLAQLVERLRQHAHPGGPAS